MPQFQERRGSAATRFSGALKYPGLIAKAERPDAIAIVHGEEKIDGIELSRSRLGPRPFRHLAPLRVVPQDDSAAPTVGFGIGNRRMKPGTLRGFAVILRTGDQRQVRLQRKAVRGRQPSFVLTSSRP